MADSTKGMSPFYPGQPVPIELFVGRLPQISRIMERGVQQTAQGKPTAFYIQGEYGIGKSSLANLIGRAAESDHGLHSIYAPLGGCKNLNDVAISILEATIRSGAYFRTRSEKILEHLSKYIRELKLYGITIDFEALRKDAPNISSPFSILSFLKDIQNRLKDTGITGILLILDEINGVSSNPDFAQFLKGLVDTNAMDKEPLPLVLILCGVEERRRELIKNHQSIDRIFDVIQMDSMSDVEMKEFFKRAFTSAKIEINDDALFFFTTYSSGFPKIMHLIGDAAYWLDNDGVIDKDEAIHAVIVASDEVGKKYVDQQVFKTIKSNDYRSILKKIARVDLTNSSFIRSDIAADLNADEKKKLDNFLQRMKKLKVLKPGDSTGEWIFINRIVQLYISWQNQEIINKRRK